MNQKMSVRKSISESGSWLIYALQRTEPKRVAAVVVALVVRDDISLHSGGGSGRARGADRERRRRRQARLLLGSAGQDAAATRPREPRGELRPPAAAAWGSRVDLLLSRDTPSGSKTLGRYLRNRPYATKGTQASTSRARASFCACAGGGACASSSTSSASSTSTSCSATPRRRRRRSAGARSTSRPRARCPRACPS